MYDINNRSGDGVTLKRQGGRYEVQSPLQTDLLSERHIWEMVLISKDNIYKLSGSAILLHDNEESRVIRSLHESLDTTIIIR